MIKARLLFVVLFSAVLFSACANRDKSYKTIYGDTLADLPKRRVAENYMPVPIATLDQIEDSYRSAFEVAEDSKIKQTILVRLADIEMARSENEQLDATEQKRFFDDAIEMYEQLVTLDAEKAEALELPTNERLLYQLSKAYALDGRIEESNEVLTRLVTEFPDSAFSAESDFRRAELAFSNGNYDLAESLYSKVMAVGEDTPFYTNALYMRGWTRFKSDRYRASIPSFTEVLDRTLVEGRNFDELSNSQRNMAQDTLRVLSIVFSYLDGAETISEVYSNLGERHYQFMLYSNLGELYFEKEQFNDSAETYLHYVRRFPSTEQSPAFSVKAIQVYELGGFPSLVLPAKEEFVFNYGANSEFWKTRDEAKRAQLKPYLKTYLTELSSYYHAEGQALDSRLAEYETLTASGKRPKKRPEPSRTNYLKAAGLYQEYVTTFPQDPKIPELTYLQGEAYYSAGDLEKSVDAYDSVAFQFIDKTFGADAGYNSVLIMGELIEAAGDKKRSESVSESDAWLARKINSAISFSDYYSTDERAVPVLTKATQEVFQQGDFVRAETLAERLTQWQPAQSNELQKTAWLILSHSRFDLQKYALAEAAYRQLLSRLTQADALYPEVAERLAATIFRQAETQIASEDREGAIERLLSIRDVAPATEIAIKGQYDAINYLIELQNWSRAELELDDFRRRYAPHELASTLLPKYALVYQETEQWEKAAGILSAMAQSGDPEAKRTSQYLAAELYQRSGNLRRSIRHYRDYVNTYPEPFDLATEARFNLVELNEKTGDTREKDFWLNKLIDANKKIGSGATPRSRSLAAMAMMKFANDEFDSFKRIKLSLPIKNSMSRKKSAMETTLKMYTEIMDFGIADYVTEANHRIADIYATLSDDLMNSQRPNGLDALALEQYEILLEEQAFPFEEKAIDIFASNTSRAQKGIYDDWVKQSFESLAGFLPARYGKKENVVEASDAIH